MKNGEIYFKDSNGKTHYLGKLADFIFDEIVSDNTDMIEPTVEYKFKMTEEPTLFKRNQGFSISFNVTNVNKDVLFKEFIEPYIQYEFERELIYSWLKNYRYKQMKAKGMADRDIVIEEVYKKHCWKYNPRN